MKTIIEPFKIKMVEQLNFTTPEHRRELIRKAYYNPFLLHTDDVMIDLLTDSGTTAMSAKQWSRLIDGDEGYAGSRSYYAFEDAVKDIMGMEYVIPTHQGRAAERILFSILGGEGLYIPNNTHFDTTRANIEESGAVAVDLPTEIGTHPAERGPFKGNMDIPKLKKFIEETGAANIPVGMITVTNNSGGGQPVSMENIRETKKVLASYGIPLFIDACRFAENAYFIKMREHGYENKSIREIAQEMFRYADGVVMSAKKDALVNTGGFLAMRNGDLAQRARTVLIVTEGFTTYGGLAGRDLEAIAQGLVEVLDEDYLHYRIRSVEYFGEKLVQAGVPILEPPGGHAIYLDAVRFAPHIPPEQFPGQAIVVALYEHAGIRACEIGSVMFGRKDDNGKHIGPPMELVRMAIPRRVYTQSHIDYCVEAVIEVYEKRNSLKPLNMTYEAPALRHFTAHFETV